MAQELKRPGSAARSVTPTTVQSDWRVTDRCRVCGGSVFTLRRGPDFGRQDEHTPNCGKDVR